MLLRQEEAATESPSSTTFVSVWLLVFETKANVSCLLSSDAQLEFPKEIFHSHTKGITIKPLLTMTCHNKSLFFVKIPQSLSPAWVQVCFIWSKDNNLG